MEVFLVAAAAFTGAVVFDGVIATAAEIGANWNGQWASHHFWNIDADSNGSAAERLAAELVGRVPAGDGAKGGGEGQGVRGTVHLRGPRNHKQRKQGCVGRATHRQT